MDYVFDLLVPILGGLLLGAWMESHWHTPPLLTVGLAIGGFVLGLAAIYRRLQPPKS